MTLAGFPLAETPLPGGGQFIPRPGTWRAGGPAPWSEARPTNLAVADVVAAVARRPDRSQAVLQADARHSAVLVLLGPGLDGAEVLLTRRAMHLTSHPGQISFAGGRVDGEETYEQAALREAHEEVGLDPSVVSVHGRLDSLYTAVSASYIVPVIATVDSPPVVRAATSEVDRLLWVPLAELARPGVFREEIWTIDGSERPIFFFELFDETVWGATARVLHQLLSLALWVGGPGPEPAPAPSNFVG